MYNYRSLYENELIHYGIRGQKWGVRRFQNPDGTLTDAGKKRYNVSSMDVSAKRIERDHRSGKIDADKLLKSGAKKLSDEDLERYAYTAANGYQYEKGDTKRLLDRMARIAYSEIADRSSFRAFEDLGKEPHPKTAGKTELDAEFWRKRPDRIKMLEEADKKMRYSAKTDEEKDRRVHKWENARDDDKFDINFLEAVQNSKILHDGDKQALVIEYAYYLADPHAYMQSRHLDEY